jgi:two-component system chemotaxis response regulator CheY
VKILAVDDTASVRALLVHCLRQAGHDVIEAENGADALTLLDEHRPALVISDLNMPVMDGIEFTRACRSHEAGRATPIILLTTETGAALRAEARAAGATAWLVKPFQPESLLTLVFQFEP